MRISVDVKKLLVRTVIFIALFVLVSGIIGPWVISTKLLYGFNFFIYGNLGKLVIFSVIIFFLLTRDRIHTLKVHKFTLGNYLYLAGAAILIQIFFQFSKVLLTYNSFTSNLPLSVFTHIVLIAIPLLVFIGVYGRRFTISFVKTFRKELMICLGISLLLFLSIFQVWKLWPYLSAMVLQIQFLIFSHLYPNVAIIPPRGLFVNTFAVEIEEACSGLESIFLFTVLYIIICVLDWKKLIIKRVFLVFPMLIACLVLINILRVFLLILIGILINPQIMAELFHTYLGLILFVIFFILFLRYGYTWLQTPQNDKKI